MFKTHTIAKKLFFSTIFIMLAAIITTVLFGSQLMESYYLHNKTSELKQSYQSFALALANNENYEDAFQPISDVLYDLEKRNINAMLFTIESDGSISQIIVTSRYNDWYNKQNSPIFDYLKPEFDPVFWLDRAKAAGAFTEDIQSSPLIISGDDNRSQNTIDLYSQLPNGAYLFLSTPREQITLATQLATQYYVILACVTSLLLIIATYFQTKRFTRPIQAIDSTAKRISQMDFTLPCNINTGDELQTLSESINIMSQNLQNYIEEIKLNQQLLQKDLERETKTNSMRREFIASVSHDFKTPLTLIRAYTEDLAEKNPQNKAVQKTCNIILKEDQRMTNLVTQLLQLSKLEGGVGTLEVSLFPIDDAIGDIINNSRILSESKNISLTFNSNDPEEHLVYGDYNKILQVLHNLIENALKYCPDGGEIAIESKNVAENKYRFSITNSVDKPLSNEELEDIFISFHRLDKARSNDGQNFGLGLAIVKAIMNLHEQNFGVYNLPDKKICFYFELNADTEEIDDFADEIDE